MADFSNSSQVKQSTYTCNSKSIVAECKSLHMKVKGEEFGGSKRNVDMEIFGVVSIGGAIVCPH